MNKVLWTWPALVLGSGLIAPSSVLATCTVPNSIANGQVADASKVMANFNAVANCADAHVPAGSANSIQTNAGSGVFGSVGPLSNGQVLIGSTGSPPQAATITAGTGINIVNGPGSITISQAGSSGGPGGGGDIVMALNAAWAKEMVLHGPALTAGTSRSVIADKGAYVGIRMVANTNNAFGSRVISSVTYTVPAGAVAFVTNGAFSNEESSSPAYYSARLYNVTQSRVAGAASYTVPSQSPGTANWAISNSGMLSTGAGGNATDVNAYYPVAGSAGDVLRLEAWTATDGYYRIQDFAVYLLVVDATTGDPIS